MPARHVKSLFWKRPLATETRSAVGAASERRRTGWLGRLLCGAAIAVPLGAGVGYLAQPDLGERPSGPSVTAARRAPLTLEVRQPDAEPTVASNILVAREPERPLASDAVMLPPPPPPLPPLRRPDAGEKGRLNEGLSRQPAQSRAARREEGPSFNCRFARTGAEQMVCEEPDLAAADRRLNDAYEQAVASGITRRAMRREQDDWLQFREDAARESPQAVSRLYEQRIEELLELARVPG